MASKKNSIEEILSSGKQIKINDIAQLSGVSPTTVSRVLNSRKDLVSQKTYRKIEKIIKALNYHPAALGRALRQSSSDLVGLFLPDTQNPFYSAIADSIEICLQKDGFNMILCNTREDPAIQDVAFRNVLSLRIRCIVLLGGIDSPGLRKAMTDTVPILFVNRMPPQDLDAPFIGIDNYAAGSDIARLLSCKGMTKSGIIRGPQYSQASNNRFDGFLATMAALETPVEQQHIWQGNLTIQSGYDLGKSILDDPNRVQTVFCANDLIAYGLYRRAIESDIKVPEQLYIVGFDDNPLNRWLAPWLTSVHVPTEEFGPIVRAMVSHTHPFKNNQILIPYKIRERGYEESSKSFKEPKP